MAEFNLTRVDRLRYRATKVAEDFLEDLRITLMPGDRAAVARLAIARSLYEPIIDGEPSVLNEEMSKRSPIEGVHLFGEDGDIWSCLVASSVADAVLDEKEFKALVELHWHRGAQFLKGDYNDVKQVDTDFIVRLAGMVPLVGGSRKTQGTHQLTDKEGPLVVPFGEASREPQTEDPIRITLNGKGTSPHIAIMGRTRTGKSRVGLEVGKSIAQQTDLPLIIIDPKGEFVKDNKLVGKPEWNGETLDRFFPGIQPIDIPLSPMPLDFLWRPTNAQGHDLAQLAITFKDSFQKCIKARGDVALDTLREAVLDLLTFQSRPVSLEDVLLRFNEFCDEAGKKPGGITAKLSEINSLNMIRPTMAPGDFFSKRWVISFGSCSEEPKRLVIFLLLDALNTYLMSLPDSGVDPQGHRSMRHMLIIDEAKEVLSYKHGALSSLIRKSASKGGLTMLLSQGPDDFDQEEDDFLEQMGTIGAFALGSSNVRNLAGAYGRKMRIEDFSDHNLPPGVALVKMPGLSPKKVIGWE
ncbi:DndE family protein [Pseudodesulfovibrio thermohalotolerans]|uniref:DndE family protein n=1 Tax=Pseudodesulfovibrio thermohalotolerans TaxID=2880651 RepID=UPI002443150B|nr:DndE family protein [Pseudodesulfovibrio thermohalotolerans]WFS63398.1 DndE family protein [Pseudodesulfovibrio thermohalotolerans]